jgi:hypothetical protein
MSPHGVEARFSVNNRKEFIGIYYSTQFATIVNEIKQKKKPPSFRITAYMIIMLPSGCFHAPHRSTQQ